MKQKLYLAGHQKPYMNLSFRLLGALALFFCFISCKKDDNNNNANKTRLSKLISFRTETPSTNITTTEFIYDDQKRVVEVVKLIGDSLNGEIKSAKNNSIKFFYNGNDKNPYMSLGSLEFSNPKMEIYYSYDVTGFLIRDSMASPPMSPSSLNRYFYFTNHIIVENEYQGNAIPQITKDSFIIANQNLTEAYTYIEPSPTIIYGNKLSYDDKSNPLNTLNISSVCFPSYPFGLSSYLKPGYFKNNITEYTHGSSTGQGPFIGNAIVYYSYSYGANNLPEECRFFNGYFNNMVKYYYIE
jgi:hypothetical protein